MILYYQPEKNYIIKIYIDKYLNCLKLSHPDNLS